MGDTDEDIEKTENLPEDFVRTRNAGGAEDSEAGEYIKGSEFEDSEIHYNSEDYISGPKRSKDGTVPIDILKLHHSFAYDCQRYFNICVAHPDTIIFASGNLIHFFNVVENKISFRRCSTGGGIGHITKNPKFNHIAVGENGNSPPIIIYEWPSLEIITVLRHGTTRLYSHLAYSTDGQLLASQGGEPDYLITIWNWQLSKIILRNKCHGQDVFNIMFSPSVPGHLTTSGLGHIKFWKMATTFTGLKLKGELGRFGKTEISDILGVYPMPDEKVVSGCEWGNILVWDEGLIKFEVCRKNRKPCHTNVIMQFEYNNGELISIGMDGWIRMWFYDSIDQADPPEEDRFLEIEPVYEFCISETEKDDSEKKTMLMYIQKKEPDDPETFFWYAQDANGGLWLIDLSTLQTPEPSRKLLTCHAGPITDIASADWGPFVATCGKDNYLHMYNYDEKKMIFVHKFNDIGSRIVWLPCAIENTGSTIVCAFKTGLIRIITANVLHANQANDIKGQYVKLLQVLKPHTKEITVMSLNSSNDLLVTGSKDCTIFVFLIEKTSTYPSLIPIGFVKTPSGVTCLTWKREFPTKVLLGCFEGDCMEVTLPNKTETDAVVTYELKKCKPRFFKFQSVKSEIRRELVRIENEKRREARLIRKRTQMEQLKLNNPGIEIDDEAFLMNSQEDEPLPEIYIPKVPNPVLTINYTPIGTICLTMAGFDAGYLYEYPKIESYKAIDSKPIRSMMIFEADDTEIRSCLFFNNDKYAFLGMQHGEIRVCQINTDNYMDLSNYWILAMHDNFNGCIPKMLFSYDQKMLLTCGYDGNLFSFYINDETFYLGYEVPIPDNPLDLPASDVEDIEESNHPSLEEVVFQKEYTRMSFKAQEKKNNTLALLQDFAQDFTKLMEDNRSLLKSQQIPQKNFELDLRITEDLHNQLKEELDFVYRKMVFKAKKSKLRLKKLMDHFIEPITCLPFAVFRILNPNTKVHSFRELKLGEEFLSADAEVAYRLLGKDKSRRLMDSRIFESITDDENKEVLQGIESFLKGLSPSTVQYKLGVEINQLLRKYRARKARLEEREKEWSAVYASKPDQNDNRPDDLLELERARNTIGDFKLKSSPEYKKIKESLDTVLSKYNQLLDCRKRAHYLREDFNTKLRAVRTKKLLLQRETLEMTNKLRNIQHDIPKKKIIPIRPIFTINYDVEFPENDLKIEKYKSMTKKVEEVKKKRQSMHDDTLVINSDKEYDKLAMFLKDNRTIQLERDTSLSLDPSTLPEKYYIVQTTVPPDVLQTLSANEDNESAWKQEMKRIHILRKIFEQDFISNQIEKNYQDLDTELDVLEKDRLEIVSETVYLDLLLLTLHQELIILKNFEVVEDSLTEKVNDKLRDLAIVKKKIQFINLKSENKNKEILKLNKKIKDLLVRYTDAVNENKFQAFLLRIFKKKYKQPKGSDESSSSSSSSSSENVSDDDDDAGSIDSREIGMLQIDENVLPIGCDKELYDMAFILRQQRYKYELQIREEQKKLEGLRKDLDLENKKLKVVEHDLINSQEDLEAFMQKKQDKLNEIDMTVVLKFNQLQHFIPNSETVAKIRDCTLFDKDKLSQLYARVGELQKETLSQLTDHKTRRTHLYRIKMDCKHMESDIAQLKAEIKYEMIRKFGQEISIDILYEAVLRSLIYDIKANIRSIAKSYEEQIRCVKENYKNNVDMLKNYIEDNTEKLSFLTVLEEEQMKLRQLLKITPISSEKYHVLESQYLQDIINLERVLESQVEQKKLFRNEIRNLSMKSKSLVPICSKGEIN